jgi:hypothetical protein
VLSGRLQRYGSSLSIKTEPIPFRRYIHTLSWHWACCLWPQKYVWFCSHSYSFLSCYACR